MEDIRRIYWKYWSLDKNPGFFLYFNGIYCIMTIIKIGAAIKMDKNKNINKERFYLLRL